MASDTPQTDSTDTAMDDLAPPRTHVAGDDTGGSILPTPIDFEAVVQTAASDDDADANSHREWDPRVFHASQTGYHEWLLMVKKLGLDDVSGLAGTFKTGTLIHECIQEYLTASTDMRWDTAHRTGEIERATEVAEDGLRIVGQADLVDPTNDIVYDIKTRANWYNHNPPVDRHVDQLHCYMRGVGADYGQVIYVSKSDMEVRTWPEGGPFTFDDERWAEIKARCKRVRDALYEQGYPQCESDIPFEKPDSDHPQSYFVQSTDLDFSAVQGGDA